VIRTKVQGWKPTGLLSDTLEGVSATTWESSDLRFDDKCNHLGVTP
jgi:hypothetical protein